MKATYLLIKSSVLSVTDATKPDKHFPLCREKMHPDAIEECDLGSKMAGKCVCYNYDQAIKAFNESFIKVDNPQEASKILADLSNKGNGIVPGLYWGNEGLFPAPEGIEFEVNECDKPCSQACTDLGKCGLAVAVVSLVDAKEKEQSGEPGNEAKKEEVTLKPKWIDSLELKVRLSKSAGLKQVSLDYDEIDRLLKIAKTTNHLK